MRRLRLRKWHTSRKGLYPAECWPTGFTDEVGTREVGRRRGWLQTWRRQASGVGLPACHGRAPTRRGRPLCGCRRATAARPRGAVAPSAVLSCRPRPPLRCGRGKSERPREASCDGGEGDSPRVRDTDARRDAPTRLPVVDSWELSPLGVAGRWRVVAQ